MSNPFSSGSSSFTSQALPAAGTVIGRTIAAKNEQQAQQQRLAKAQRTPTIIGPAPREANAPYSGDRLGAGT